MERREFLKAAAVTGATAALDGCGNPEHQLIRFVPEEDLIPGIATWKPSLCTLCPAGCGVLVRVMEGEAEVVRNGRLGLIKMGLAKKLEGNPHHPISQGKLCPRGQAGLQITYHPDRIRNPLKQTGLRGSGLFQEISWDDAVKELVSQLASLRSAGEAASLSFLTGPLRGQRRQVIERFLRAFGAPPPVSYQLFDEGVLRRANFLSFGRSQLPTLDLERASYVISFGADFLGTWNSPVAQNIAYGEMRQGHPGRRGKFVQVEARMSQTGANADEWIACRPGTEGMVALGIAHLILRQQLRSASSAEHAGQLIAGWSQGLPDFAPQEVEQRTGVAASTLARIAREISQNGPAAAILGGAPLAHTNGLFNALAVNALHALVSGPASPDQPGVVRFTPEPLSSTENTLPEARGGEGNFSAVKALVQEMLLEQPHAPKVLLLYETNPVFSLPPSGHVREALKKVPFLASFGSFIDETSALADLILPDHSPLESWLDDIPESGTTQAVASLAPPALRPLHNTRAMPDVLLDVAHQLGGDLAAALPWKTFDEMLRVAFEPLRTHRSSLLSTDPDEFWKKVQEQGGWWSATPPFAGLDPAPASGADPATARRQRHRRVNAPHGPATMPHPPANLAEPEFDAAEKDFPFHFLPYASQAFLDGSLAHLPWLQEMPDVLSTALWGTWVEINPKTAERLSIRQGDLVEIASQHGSIRAPAVVSPGIAPDVIAMPVGQGHENFGRYASQRGTNPLSILAPMIEQDTGALAWAATRVKIARLGKGKLILFGGGMSRFPNEQERR